MFVESAFFIYFSTNTIFTCQICILLNSFVDIFKKIECYHGYNCTVTANSCRSKTLNLIATYQFIC